MNQCQLFCEFHYTHTKEKKSMSARSSMFFHASDKSTNQEVNFDVISNVMTFLTLHVKSLDSI